MNAWTLGKEYGSSQGTVRYEVFGIGSPLVLVHGTPFSTYVWRKVGAELGRTRRRAFRSETVTDGRTKGVPMDMITSSDGTRIAFDRMGDGPPVVMVCGQSTDRSSNAPLAALLAEHFAVFNYDRRGRGDSGDTLPYAVEREIEDIGALIGEAGGSASVFGVSSGAALALEASASGLPVDKLALWEPPFDVPEGRRPPEDLAERYREMLAEGRRGDG